MLQCTNSYTCPSIRPIDEYQKITSKEEKKRLSKLINELREKSLATGLIIKQFTPNTSKRDFYLKLLQILKFSERYGIDKNRIIFLLPQVAEEKTILFIVSPNAKRPEASDKIV